MTKQFTTLLGAVLVCLFSLATNVRAQGVTTAAITGVVVDQQGETLPGANVVAVHEPTGTIYGTTTRTDGRFDLTNMQVGGPYTITASFVGFQDTRETDIQLQLGQRLTLTLQLSESTVLLEEIQVAAERNPILNSDRTGAATNVSTEQIERMPTIARSIQDFTRLTPQISGNSVAGRNNRYNNIQIDGAVLNDVFGLAASGTPGGQANTQPISLDAIAEFNVAIAPYDIRQNGFTGGLINAVTRRGTNTFEGSAYYFGRNESFVGDGPNERPFGEFSESQYGFRLGGPIVRNKAFFFVNAELARRDAPIDVGLAGSNASVVFNVPDSTVNRVIGVLQNRYGYDPGSFDIFTAQRNSDKFFARVDVNLSNQHRLTLRHNYVDAVDDNLTRNANTFFLSNTNYVFNSTQNQTVAQLNSTFGNRIANEFRLAYTRVRDHRDTPGDPFPSISVTLAPGTVLTAGTEQFSIGNRLDQDLFELENNLTYFAGDHTITVGTHNELFKFENGFFRNLYGRYEFSSLDAFLAGTPSRYEYSYSLVEGNPRPVAAFDVIQTGLYVQDEWNATPRLKLTVGLRADLPIFLDEPLFNPNVELAFGRRTDEPPSGNILFSPRLGFNYSTLDQATQVRGGLGIFSGRAPFVWLSNQFGNTGVDVARVLMTSNIPFTFTADIDNQPRPGVTPGLSPVSTAEVNLADTDFRLPQVFRTNLAVDRSLPFGLVATLEGIYTKTLNEVFYQDINLGSQVSTDPIDGRPIYGTRSTGSRGGFSVTSNRADHEAGVFLDDNGNPVSRFTNAILLSNTNKGFQYSITGQIQKLPGDGLFGSLAYTYSRAKDLQAISSSQASSNWGFSLTPGNPNAYELTTSNYELRHRIIGALSYRFDFGRFFGMSGLATTASLFYEGRSGAPYSIVYAGDVNADTRNANDLIYVPADASEINLVRRNEAINEPAPQSDYDALFAWLEEYGLDEYRGKILERNVLFSPWSHQFDLRIAQEIPTIRGQRFELTLDILNVTNLLNKDWGTVKFVTNQSYNGLFTVQGVNAQNELEIELNRDVREGRNPAPYTVSDLASRWQLQLGVRYTF